jgi:MFS family permease
LILSIVPRFRKFTGSGIVLGTFIGGAIFWLLCFYIIYSLWGFLGVLIGVFFLGLGVYFTAILALLFSSQFVQALMIALGVAQIFFLRWLGYWIITKYKPPQREPVVEEDFSSEKYVAVPAKKLLKKSLSLGVVFLSIFLFISGAVELFTFFKNPYLNMRIVWGCLTIASGIGLLLQKFWAYRLTQVLVIINIVTSPFYLFLPEFNTQVAMIIVGMWIIINGGILWYLSRKNVKEEFLEPALIEKLEKRRSTS